MIRTFYFYTLTNPNNGEIFYVGVTTHPETRQKMHCIIDHYKNWKKERVYTPKDKYIIQHNINPVMDIIEKAERFTKFKPSWFPIAILKREAEIINEYISNGHPLTNGVKHKPIKKNVIREMMAERRGWVNYDPLND